MSTPRNPHIVVDGRTGSFECTRCLKEEKIRLLVTISEFKAQGDAFTAKHADCPPWVPMIRRDPEFAAKWRPGETR